MTFIIEALTQFLYPTSCLHCGQMISSKEKDICKECFKQIQWLDVAFACQVCGHPKRLQRGVRCAGCRKKPIYLQPYAACFAPYGPTWALLSQIEDTAKLLASLMVMKWKELPWPLPDVVVPMPRSRLESFSRKRQPSYLLAKELSQFIKCHFAPAVTTREKGNSFDFISHGDLSDQKVLFLIDVMRESQEVKKCRFELESLFPKTIYTLALFDIRF